MSQTSWHVTPQVLGRYYDDPGSIDDVTASSIEAHLTSCEACRTELTQLAPIETISMSWESVADRVDRPRVSPMEWTLDRLGMRSGIARLLTATPALRLAGLTATLVIAAAAVAMSISHGTDGPFLILAPLAPLAAVYASFAPSTNPVGETAVATPLNGLGLVLRRAAVVLVITLGVLGISSLALPSLDAEAMAWVLPALALSIGALALATWIPIEYAVLGLGVGWLTLLWTIALASRRATTTAMFESGTFSVVGQLIALAGLALSITIVVVRRDTFAAPEARS